MYCHYCVIHVVYKGEILIIVNCNPFIVRLLFINISHCCYHGDSNISIIGEKDNLVYYLKTHTNCFCYSQLGNDVCLEWIPAVM